MRAKLTNDFVARQRLQPKGSGGRWLHDTELRGFALYVGETCRTFYASAEHRGRLMRRKIGRHRQRWQIAATRQRGLANP